MSLSLTHSLVPIVQNVCPQTVVATVTAVTAPGPLVCGHFPCSHERMSNTSYCDIGRWGEYIEYMGARESSPSESAFEQ